MNNDESVLFCMNEFTLTYSNGASVQMQKAGTRLAGREMIMKVTVSRKVNEVKEPNLSGT